MDDLTDILSQRGSEYFQHDQGKTLNFSDMEYETPLDHP